MDWVRIAGWIGPIVGGGVGLLGGALGTYAAVKNTRGPRERAFAVKSSILCWILVALFVAGMAMIPGWHKIILVISYVIALFFGVRRWNEIQFRIQREETGPTA